MQPMNQIERDAELIRALGGPTKVARLLSPVEPVLVQSVQNWLHRGIPSRIKVLHPHIFMQDHALTQAPVSSENAAQGV